MKSLSFKYKLVISMLVMSLVPLMINSFYSLRSSREELKKAAFDKLSFVSQAKNKNISQYLHTVSSQLVTLSHNKMMIDASREFIGVYKRNLSITDEASVKLKKYYSEDFADEYKNKTGEESSYSSIVDQLPLHTVVLQNAFISSNQNPLGSKHLLDESQLVPDYSRVHKVYHPTFREYLETFSLYDIFIVDIDSGDIVYTVFKELDFSTNLYNGPFKNSNLAEVVLKARELKDKKAFAVVDFKRYGPSYEAPASFIASPIWDGDKKIALLVFQMPLGTINSIMQERSGLGQTGEAYLVGQDKLLRSDTHNDKEFNIYNSFNKEKVINSPFIADALNNKASVVITNNYQNKEVLSAIVRIDYPHFPWVIFAEQQVSEAFEGANIVLKNVLIFILVSIIAVVAVSVMITNNLSKQIEEVVEAFSSSAHDVQNSSQKMDLISNKLYRSVQTQIASITESAAAMDEISAMLKNNSKSSQNASNLSVSSKNSATMGKDTVNRMMEEVGEISKSYDDIQKSVEKNNSDISKIIQVIEEIAKKTQVINEIVFQTKLLSFNASVEAARAGESGKGFAVVAEEIANLATMSGKAAGDIEEMLSSSQRQVSEIAESTKAHISSIVNDGRLKVRSGTNVATLCMEQLDNILKNINELDNSIQEINVAIKEQSTGVEEVNTAMKYLENATHETTDMSERSKGASEELRNQSHALRVSIQALRKILGAKKSYDAPVRPEVGNTETDKEVS